MKKYLIILFTLLAISMYGQKKVGIYPIYFADNTELNAFETSYSTNGYSYIDEKHPLIAYVEQDSSWYFFDFRGTGGFIKTSGGSGGSGSVSEITDTISLGISEGAYTIALHNDGTGKITHIVVPNTIYANNATQSPHKIGTMFANGDGLPKEIYESTTGIFVENDSIGYVDEKGDTTKIQPDKTIYGIPVSSTAPLNGQILKYNGTNLVFADDDVSGGAGTDGVVNSANFSGTSTQTLTLTRSNGLSNIVTSFNNNDADADPANEIQTISKSGTTVTLSNSGGSFVLGDEDPANEIQTISKTGSAVTLSNGGGSFTDEVDDADADNSNELQTISKSGSTVTLSQGGGSFTDEVDDADADPTNENQTVSEGWGINITQTGQDYEVEADSTEIATIFDLSEKKDIFVFDLVNLLALTAATETDIKSLTLGGSVYRSYTTVIDSKLEFIQGYIDQKSAGGTSYRIRVYKRSGGSSILLNTINVAISGKTYFSFDYTGTSGIDFSEGDDFFITVESNANTSEVMINYSIYFSRDTGWTGAPK